jgi:hypothetical protein
MLSFAFAYSLFMIISTSWITLCLLAGWGLTGAWQSVLPGPVAAFPLVEQKLLPLFGENTQLFQVFLQFRYFPVIFSLYCLITFNSRKQFSLNVSRFFLQTPAKQNSATFLLLLAKAIAVPLSKSRRFMRKFPLNLGKIAVYTAIWQHCLRLAGIWPPPLPGFCRLAAVLCSNFLCLLLCLCR